MGEGSLLIDRLQHSARFVLERSGYSNCTGLSVAACPPCPPPVLIPAPHLPLHAAPSPSLPQFGGSLGDYYFVERATFLQVCCRWFVGGFSLAALCFGGWGVSLLWLLAVCRRMVTVAVLSCTRARRCGHWASSLANPPSLLPPTSDLPPTDPTLPQAACQSPAIFELLPPADFPYAKPPPQLTLWLKQPIPDSDAGLAAAAVGVQTGLAVEGTEPLLCCAAHQQYVVQPEAAAVAAAAAAAAAADAFTTVNSSQATGRSSGSSASTQHSLSSAAASPGSSGSLQSAEQYVFGHDHLPGLLARLLKDNAGAASSAPVVCHAELHCIGVLVAHALLPPPTQPACCAQQPCKAAAACAVAEPCELSYTFSPLTDPAAVQVDGAAVPMPFQQELWALAQASHDSWRGARLPPGCAFYNLHGAGISTPYDVQYGSWWLPLSVRGVGERAGWCMAAHNSCAMPSLQPSLVQDKPSEVALLVILPPRSFLAEPGGSARLLPPPLPRSRTNAGHCSRMPRPPLLALPHRTWRQCRMPTPPSPTSTGTAPFPLSLRLHTAWTQLPRWRSRQTTAAWWPRRRDFDQPAFGGTACIEAAPLGWLIGDCKTRL